jgi:hypothetical protein
MSDRNPPAIDDMERQKSRDPHAAIIQLDILEVIVDICEAEKAYGTIRRMALISKHHRAIVQPRLDRIRKRVVLRLDDYQWRDKGNDRNIEYAFGCIMCCQCRADLPFARRIIECSRMSPLPIDLNPSRNNDIEQQLSDFRARLRPKVILCKDRPLDSLARFINYFFPKTKLFVVSEHSRSQVIGDASAFVATEADANRELEPYERFNAAVSAYCADAYQLGTVVTFRYRLRRAYRQLAANQPGQRLHVLRAVTSDKDKIRSNVWLHDAGFRQESILEECVSARLSTFNKSIVPARYLTVTVMFTDEDDTLRHQL